MRALRELILITTTTVLGLLWSLPASASQTGSLPWNEPLETLQENISGPTADTLMLIAIAVGAMLWGLADDNRGVHRMGKALAGLAIVAKLASLLTALGINAALL